MVQFFLVQLLVASAWVGPTYSWRGMTISELGATVCSQVDGRYMCSPLYSFMNVSFVLLGAAMLIGSLMLYAQLKQAKKGFILMAIAGLGVILVGFVPTDTIYWLHIVGADVAFLLGNIALIILGFKLCVPGWLKWYLDKKTLRESLRSTEYFLWLGVSFSTGTPFVGSMVAS